MQMPIEAYSHSNEPCVELPLGSRVSDLRVSWGMSQDASREKVAGHPARGRTAVAPSLSRRDAKPDRRPPPRSPVLEHGRQDAQLRAAVVLEGHGALDQLRGAPPGQDGRGSVAARDLSEFGGRTLRSVARISAWAVAEALQKRSGAPRPQVSGFRVQGLGLKAVGAQGPEFWAPVASSHQVQRNHSSIDLGRFVETNDTEWRRNTS